jgi:tRNA-2-methylthio-N6-dimethylallyladenosine synthase
MNQLDGQLVADRLRALGLAQAEDPAEADLLLTVTCSVRQHAEDRVYSNLGKLKHRHRREPHLLIGLLGCMAEKDREGIFRRLPHVDFICGPNQLDRLEDLIRDAAARRAEEAGTPSVSETPRSALGPSRAGQSRNTIDDHLEPFEAARLTPVGDHSYHAYVRVMRGCDNFCSYCIVPFVRGSEASRPPHAVLEEVARLVAAGVRHVTLLGQSIGGYARDDADGHPWRLADLIRAAVHTPGLLRLDFVTMHPRTLTADVLDLMAQGDPVAAYLHIPAQSGADRILAAMNRGYTVAQYRQAVAEARRRVPAVDVASDFIVGFPGETEDDFAQTLDLIRDMQFSQVFAFKYSVRPGTAASRLPDDVPTEVKEDRLARLLAAQRDVATQANRDFIGRTLACLVTGPSAKPHLDPAAPGDIRLQLAALTPGNRLVMFRGSPDLIGRLVPVRITRASALTLFGDAAV